ncbi:PREDICTED: transmembrane protein 54 [Fulmarus glacialis]|uniref:transmembrane protein 54 n=1 Tax=Fulmarus glacialis TaxID=30455 RepID=UPI00051AAC79|nr:PREDICTED: transmembrane protein 54 [Fulmarus glacialis]
MGYWLSAACHGMAAGSQQGERRALARGSVLRFVLNPRAAIPLQYAIANAASVISALLTVSCGIAALMLSRYLAPAALAVAPVSRECPFDPTRVYSSTLSLWAISLLLDSMEIVSLQVAPAESPDPGQCLGLLRLDSVETAQL